MKQDEALIQELCTRFEKKPRKCRKINDSNIGSAQRIVCVNSDTFYYFPKIQQFQDLDFDKLQYVVPKAGVKLHDILQLRFPPRRENERNFFSITLPKNKILKFTKTLKEIIVDEEAEGEQVWTFYFQYDIVALPIRQKKLKQAKYKQIQNQKNKKAQIQRLKDKDQRQKIEKINEEINSLNQAEELRSGGTENEQYLRKKQLLYEKQGVQKRIQQSDELFFHYHYRKLLQKSGQKQTAQLQLQLLEQIGKFRIRAQEAVRQFVDQLSFTPQKLKAGKFYIKNNLKLKFGDKNLNQQFLANSQVANTLYELRYELKNWQLRIPLKALVKYKGFKFLAVAMTPQDELADQQFDDSIIHGNSVDNWKIDFLIVDVLTLLLNKMNLKPFFSQVHYQKVQIHMGSVLKVLRTKIDPFAQIKKLESGTFQQNESYKIHYIYDIDELFPIDLDLNRNINQQNVRLRPQYINKFVKMNKQITHLSAGSFTYSVDDEEGQKQDIALAKASQILKLQQVVRFVQKLDNLDYIIQDSGHLSKVMKSNGINMRYLGKIVKITKLPYIKIMGEVQAIARVIRQIYRQHQYQFCSENFRNIPEIYSYMSEAFSSRTKQSMRKIRIKQLKQQQIKYSIINAIDFLNLIFGISRDFTDFWKIIENKVRQIYEIQMKDPQDYPHGYLLKSILYHCDITIPISDKIKLFQTAQPFSVDDTVKFNVRSKVYEYPSMSVYQLAESTNFSKQQIEQLLPRLQLQLMIKRALKTSQASVLVELSKITNKVGPPTDKYTLQGFFYYLCHPHADSFQTNHRISQTIFPSSHPFVMQLYLQYSKLKDLDPVTLKRAAQTHAIRNLGISHWKTSQILSNFKEAEYINHLIKAEAGVEESKRAQLYLQIVKELCKFGKLAESIKYVYRAINRFDKLTALSLSQQSFYFEILLQGIQNRYLTRSIQELLKLTEIFYYALMRYQVPYDSKWYYWLLYYALKAYLQSSRKKYYLFKLILVFRQQNKSSQALQDQERSPLMKELGIKWKQSRHHINYIKQILIKLEFGFTQINFDPDFFSKFDHHVNRLRNEDFNEGLKEFNEFLLIFGFKYFEEALLDNINSFQKSRDHNMQDYD